MDNARDVAHQTLPELKTATQTQTQTRHPHKCLKRQKCLHMQPNITIIPFHQPPYTVFFPLKTIIYIGRNTDHPLSQSQP